MQSYWSYARQFLKVQCSECLLYWNEGKVCSTCGHLLRENKSKKSFEGIHDRFLKDSTFRESLLSTDRTEEICIQVDEVAQKDFNNRMSQDEYFRNKELVDLSQYIWQK